jgi:restriction system protein
MAIFEHKGVWRDKGYLDAAWKKIKDLELCVYCKGFAILRPLHGLDEEWDDGSSHFNRYDMVSCCDNCGWWFAQRKLYETVHAECYCDVYCAAGNVFPLASIDGDDSVETARRELLKNWERTKGVVDPRTLEEIVASVFRSLGYHAWATAYSNDGGIDVVLEHAGKKHGVQVKRYKNNIAVEEIRSFAGALLLNGLPSGVFVTTCDYQRGCHTAVEGYEALGMPIELVNGQRFFQALDIKRREPYEKWSELFDGDPQDLPKIGGHTIW